MIKHYVQPTWRKITQYDAQIYIVIMKEFWDHIF